MTHDFTGAEATRDQYLKTLARYKDSEFAKLELFFRQTRFAGLISYWIDINENCGTSDDPWLSSESQGEADSKLASEKEMPISVRTRRAFQESPFQVRSTEQGTLNVQLSSEPPGNVENSQQDRPLSNQELEIVSRALTKDDYWDLYRSLESHAYITKKEMNDARIFALYLQRNPSDKQEFDRRRIGLKNRLYFILKDLVEDPWELRVYRGRQSTDDGGLSISFRYKNRPQFSEIKIDMAPHIENGQIEDLHYRFSFTVRNRKLVIRPV